MAEGVNSAGASSGNWFHKAASSGLKAIKSVLGFKHHGQVSKVDGKRHIKNANPLASKPKHVDIHKRNATHPSPTTKLASIRTPEAPRQSQPLSSTAFPLFGSSDPVQEQKYEMQMQLLEMNEAWTSLSSATERASAHKKKVGNDFRAAAKKAGIPFKEALQSPAFAKRKNIFMKAVQIERTAQQTLEKLETKITQKEVAIGRLELAENKEAENELKRLLAGDE